MRGVVTMLSAQGLRKSYRMHGIRRDDFVAVDGIDVRARAGEVVGIVGGTGAGKSTLAMMLLRVHEPDGGTGGVERRRVQPGRRLIAPITPPAGVLSRNGASRRHGS